MSRGETALPYRVATSAKQLARSTLSGIETDFKCPDSGKQTGSSSQTSRPSGGSRDTAVPRGAELASRENSFRSRVSTTTSKAVEDDFNRFQKQRCFKDWEPLRDSMLSTSFSDFDRFQETLDYQDDSLAQQCDEPDVSANSTAASMYIIDAEISDITHESSTDSARSSALRRLNQVGEHMRRNLIMQQAFEQEASTRSSLATHPTSPRSAHDPHHHLSRQKRRPNSPGSIRRTHSIPQTQQSTPQTRTPTQPPQVTREEEEECPLETPFHCPYYACHQNMLHRQAQSGTTTTGARSCVHVGCAFQAETLKGWTKHISLPHHDLQGSYMVVD